MAIKFDRTEAKSPNQLPADGYYYGRITDAVMKQPKDVTKNEYLNITYELFDETKTKVGVVFDILTESDKPFMEYKLKRWGQAIGLAGKEFAGLADIAKIAKGKVIIFRTKVEKNEQYGDRAVVDIGDEGIYYSKNEASSFFETVSAPKKSKENAPVKVEDTDESAPFASDDDF